MGKSLVDRAIERAQSEAKENTARYELTLPKAQLEAAKRVCERNGISLAAFMRACADELVAEYGE